MSSAALAARRLDALALGVGAAYSFASLGVVQKYAGTAAALLLLALAPVVGLATELLIRLLQRSVSLRGADLAAVGVLVLATVVFLVVYPHANTHVPGHGSDRDDAATIGARGFVHGHNPYGSLTYLHNPISQLPTMLVVAIPFVELFHSSAYELVVFLPALYLLWRAIAADSRLALACLLVALVSPALLRDYLTGGDLLSNTVLVAVGCAIAWAAPSRGRLAEVAAAALLGVTLATRANFVVVLLPLLAALNQRNGARAAARIGAVSLGVFAAITVPFALTAGGRTALRMNDKLSQVWGGAPLVLTLAVVLALALVWRTHEWSLAAVFWQAALVQALLLVAVVVNTSADSGRPDFFWLVSGYGIPTLLLALSALACRDRGEPGRTAH